MASFTSIFNFLLGIGTITFLLLSLYFVFQLLSGSKIPLFWSKNAYFLAFLVSLVSILGSLIYSLVIGFPPCDLCWYQRIFMYPLAFIFGMAHFKKEHVLVKTAFPLVIIGLIIALYHNIVSIWGVSPIPCSTDVSCTVRFVYVWGFVSIPLMSFASFLLSLLFYIIGRKADMKK